MSAVAGVAFRSFTSLSVPPVAMEKLKEEWSLFGFVLFLAPDVL